MMKAIVCVMPKKRGIRPFLKQLVISAVTCQKADVGGDSVSVYTLNPLWKCRFQKNVSELLKIHPDLLFDESMKAYPKLYRAPRLDTVFLSNLDKILTCHCGGTLLYPTVISQREDARVLPALEALSRHAKAVALCTGDSEWFEGISSEALSRFGLSVTQREQVTESDFTVLFSAENVQIFITSSQNRLLDFSSPSVIKFSEKFPHLRFPHCCLVPETEEIQKLIRKIQKKS